MLEVGGVVTECVNVCQGCSKGAQRVLEVIERCLEVLGGCCGALKGFVSMLGFSCSVMYWAFFNSIVNHGLQGS